VYGVSCVSIGSSVPRLPQNALPHGMLWLLQLAVIILLSIELDASDVALIAKLRITTELIMNRDTKLYLKSIIFIFI
jgi:hypothetical protein